MTNKTVRACGLSIVVLVAAVLFANSLQSTVQLAQASVFSGSNSGSNSNSNSASNSVNLPNNVANAKILVENQAQVSGLEKIVSIPSSSQIVPPNLTASGIIVQDVESGAVLYFKDQNTRLPIASTTKIMTALVGVEYYQPNSVLTVSENSLVEGSNMGLKLGEKLSFRSLLYGLMLNSGNDAAYTIAFNYPGGLTAFVQAMNQKAQALGLTNTHFDNPAGFDSPRHYSSASDLARMAIVASGNSQLTRVVSTKETEVASLDKTIIHNLKNLNQLLGLPGVLGMKTGYTPAAKENLVGLVEREEHRIITVVLGSDNRFGESKTLIDWTFQNYNWD